MTRCGGYLGWKCSAEHRDRTVPSRLRDRRTDPENASVTFCFLFFLIKPTLMNECVVLWSVPEPFSRSGRLAAFLGLVSITSSVRPRLSQPYLEDLLPLPSFSPVVYIPFASPSSPALKHSPARLFMFSCHHLG